jgi:hypothetical protein
MSMNKLRAVLHDLLFDQQFRNHDILFFEDNQIHGLWYVMVAHPNAVQMLVKYQDASARISSNFIGQLPDQDIDFLFTVNDSTGAVNFLPMGWNKPTLPGISQSLVYGTSDIAVAITQLRKYGFTTKDSDSICPHTWVDVGFNHSKMVCKKCNKEQN